MGDQVMSSKKPGFFSRYKVWIIAFLVVWAIFLAVLILVGGGSQLPFEYQVF
jgi:hypothetical protein